MNTNDTWPILSQSTLTSDPCKKFPIVLTYLAAALTEGALEYLVSGCVAPEEEALENLDDGGRDAPGDLNLLPLLATEPALTSEECAILWIIQTADVWKYGHQG